MDHVHRGVDLSKGVDLMKKGVDLGWTSEKDLNC